jgi:L-asparaginase/Glu-tRNA(Gln) amidotransferase subunit D
MIMMNDRIASAYYVTKTNSNTMDTFKAVEMGFLGELISDTPYFFYPPVHPTGKRAYSISNVTSIPQFDISLHKIYVTFYMGIFKFLDELFETFFSSCSTALILNDQQIERFLR